MTLVLLVGSLIGTPLVGCKRGRSSADHATAEKTQAELPRIEVESSMHDFGMVNEGSTPKHAFTIRNAGTAPLLLTEIRPSCGCTAIAVTNQEIPPGGTSSIELAFSTRGFTGENRLTITVLSNDPSNPQSVLEFKADVERLLDFEPQYIHLTSHHGVGTVKQAWLSGRLAEQAKLRITKTEGDQHVAAKLVETRQGVRQKFGLELRLTADQGASGEGNVTVSTGVTNPPELSLRFSYSVE
jgi:hypothetical protein